MNEIQAYLKQLEARNGYCSCPNLARLFSQRKHLEDLELKCHQFKSEADLSNPKVEDRVFLKDYERRSEELRKASEAYHILLTGLAKNAKLKFILHDPVKRAPIGTINYEVAASLLEENSDVILSVHCASCDQQIDIAD